MGECWGVERRRGGDGRYGSNRSKAQRAVGVMRVFYLYGPPGVGKLTVGTALAGLTGFRLFHNHLTVNLATAVFARESEPWRELIRHVRRDVFATAAREGVNLVYTGVYLGTEEQAEAIGTMLEPVYDGGGEVFFVQLTCEREEHLARVREPSRRLHDKLTDARVVEERYMGDPTLPLGPGLRLDITHVLPEEAAARIAGHFGVPTAS